MKKIVISLITLGMVNFGFAQNANPDFNLSKFRKLSMIGSNYEYLNEVQDGLTPGQVKYLENAVSHWDVSTSNKFDGRKGELFNVTFKLKDGNIHALYDNNGKIVSAIERFSNFAMPKSVSNEILKQYPNWKIVKNRYSVLYDCSKLVKKKFKVLLRKGNQEKWLRIDSSGKII